MATNNIPNADTSAPAPSDDPFEKHINIALEAQDGKADPSADTSTEGAKEGADKGKTPASTDNKDSNSGGGDKTAQQQPVKEGTEKKGAHSAKDLTLPDGTVVPGGPARRFYEQREAARQQGEHFRTQLEQTTARADKAERELEAMRSTVQSIQGMEPQQVAIGAKIVQDLQRDPVGTMKKLLAEVVAQGHTIEGIGSGVDQLAVQRMIDARMGTQQSNEPSEQEIVASAQEEANNFFRQYPDAQPHDALLARMLRDNPGVDLPSAYFQLKNAFIEKDFDWSLSLEDNLKAQSSQQQQSETPPKQPMPNGRPQTPNAQPATEVKIAHEDTDMGDIVRDAMREAGLTA